MKLRRWRWTYRARLTATYACLLTGACALVLAVVYVVVGIVPTYTFDRVLTGTHELPIEPAEQVQGIGPSMVVGSRQDLQHLLSVVALVTLLVTAVLGAIIGWLIAGRMVRPLHDISEAARRAATGRLDHRLGLGPARDEVTELAATFDRMLDTLEESVDRHRRFAANASHELRTPLAATKATLDVARSGGHRLDADLLDKLQTMNQRSIATVNALLLLSDIEAATASSESFDLTAVVRESVTDMAVAADAAGLTIVTHLADVASVGDPTIAGLLVTNLIRNAVEHNVDEGTVSVTVAAGDRTHLYVDNTGPMVTTADLERLQEPFARGGGRLKGGHGLGLLIAHAAAANLGAELALQPRSEGGVRATVRFGRGLDCARGVG